MAKPAHESANHVPGLAHYWVDLPGHRPNNGQVNKQWAVRFTRARRIAIRDLTATVRAICADSYPQQTLHFVNGRMSTHGVPPFQESPLTASISPSTSRVAPTIVSGYRKRVHVPVKRNAQSTLGP